MDKMKDNSVYIDILAIDPECHGQGLGRRIFQYIVTQFDYIHLVTHKIDNTLFYEKIGCRLSRIEQLPSSSLKTYLMTYEKIPERLNI